MVTFPPTNKALNISALLSIPSFCRIPSASRDLLVNKNIPILFGLKRRKVKRQCILSGCRVQSFQFKTRTIGTGSFTRGHPVDDLALTFPVADFEDTDFADSVYLYS